MAYLSLSLTDPISVCVSVFSDKFIHFSWLLLVELLAAPGVNGPNENQ